MSKNFKTEMVGFERGPAPQPGKSARKPKPRKSGPDKKLEEQLPKKKRGNRSHMALIESVMAEARGTGGRGGKSQGGEVLDEELPRQTRAGVKKASGESGQIAGAAVDGHLLGKNPGSGVSKRGVVPHVESMDSYVGFLAEMQVNSAFESARQRPPHPTGG